MPTILGIDFGTSTSAVAAMQRGHVVVLEDRDRIVPSIVNIGKVGQPVVGSPAKALLEHDPLFTITGIKRLLGRKFADPHVQEWASFVAYEIAEGPDGEAWVKGPDRLYSPIELSGLIFKALRGIAEARLGWQDSKRAVIGVPAYFNLGQREAIRQAALKGGIEPVRLLREPTAAAVAYGVDRAVNRNIAVYDFGGGTFDVTILSIRGTKFQTLATSGDDFLGGEDFDHRIANWIVERFKAQHGIDLRDDPAAKNRVRILAEKAKIELSGVNEHHIDGPFIVRRDGQTGPLIDLDEVLDRETFNELVSDLIDRTRLPCRKALEQAKRDVRDIADVVLVGGMTRAPLVQQVASEVFGQKATARLDPMTIVALGCASQAASIAGDLKSLDLREALPRSFGFEAGGGAFVPVLRAGWQVPAKDTKRCGLANPGDEAVRIGIYEGDLKHAADNRHLGDIVLNNLARHGEDALVDVTFDLNDDGILTVTGKDVITKETVTHRVHAASGMTAEQAADLKNLNEENDDAAFHAPN